MNKSKYADKIYKLQENGTVIINTSLKTHSEVSFTSFRREDRNKQIFKICEKSNSPFMEEQDGNAILEPIIFENGFQLLEKKIRTYNSF